MDVLSDAQWRTNTPGLPVLSAQGPTLGSKRRLSVKESGRGGCSTPLLHSLPPPPPGFVVPHHWRRDPRAFNPARYVFMDIICIITRFCAVGSNANRSRQSLRSRKNNGTANLCKDGCSRSAPARLLSSLDPAGAGERYWRTRLRRRVIWPPAAKGKPLSGEIWTVAPPPPV